MSEVDNEAFDERFSDHVQEPSVGIMCFAESLFGVVADVPEVIREGL